MYKIFALVLFTISVNSSIVTIDQGTLIGTYSTSRNGKLFNVFYGIPFGKPPKGPLRFKAPVAAGPWKGVLDATRIPIGCMELPSGTNTTKGDEDCLNLNVYTPLDARKGDNLAVLFYIYGGIFKTHSNIDHGPEYMMDRDLVIVIPNYRSGALGFLSTGDTVIPGNFGLKDQLLALKWTRRNIRHFGGDPHQITINGHSSGSICTHLHMLSPASEGLYQQAIIQSGTAFCSLGFWGPDVVQGIAKEFATKAGCLSVASSHDIYNCLMALDADVFPRIPEQMYVWEGTPDGVFRPCVEDPRVTDAFITDIPNHMRYHSPQLPLMIGLTTAESAGSVAQFLQNNGEGAAQLDMFYRALFPITMQYLWNTEPQQLDYISESIRKRFFADQAIGLNTSSQMVEMFSEAEFAACTIDTIRTYPGPTYVYWYDYLANFTAQTMVPEIGKYLGVSHSDEVNLLFLTKKSVNLLTEQDIIFSQELIKRWVNFIQTSNPNFPARINSTMMEYWQPITSRRIEYLLINMNGSMGTDLYKEAYPFWKSLPIGSKYRGYGRF